VRTVDEVELCALEPSHLLIETSAADPNTALVPDGTVDLIAALGKVTTWLVAGVGRVLPPRLFAPIDQLVSDGEVDAAVESVAISSFERIAGPAGLDRPDTVDRRVDCPVAPELLRLG